VQAAIEMDIYVIIDWHIDGPYAFDVQHEAKAFFIEMAQRYGNTPNIIWEIFNEPMNTDPWWKIKQYHLDIIPAIRQYSRNIIMLGSKSWSQDLDEPAVDPVTCDVCYNLAYSLHFYAITHQAENLRKAQVAVDKGLALFANEWGVCAYDGRSFADINWVWVKKWTDFFDQYLIGSTHWSIMDKVTTESCSLVNPSASSYGGWGYNDLSLTGKAIKAYIKDKPYLNEHGQPIDENGNVAQQLWNGQTWSAHR